MEEVYWIATFIASGICTGTGMLAWKKNPESTAARLFLAATITTTIAMFSARITDGLGEEQTGVSIAFSKIFTSSLLLSLAFYWQLTIFFPVELKVSFRPPNLLGVLIVAAILISIGAGALAEPAFNTPVGTTVISRTSAIVMLGGFVTMAVLASAFAIASRSKASEEARHSSTIYVIGLWMVAVSGFVYAADAILGHRHSPSIEPLPRLSLIIVVTGVMLYLSFSMHRGRMAIGVTPRAEILASAAKSKFNLLHRRVYLVEEPKPDFAMKLFTDILKGRCYDCEDDESFVCESLDCGACRLPCPCKKCTKYKSRTQGLIITRQYPKDVRNKLFLQTTPIIWLSTVAGRDNMDPAKLSLLTDFLVNFMEKSHNGVILVDGIEYLITSNDFQRVLRAVDKLTETAMTSSIRLILTLDPRALDEKDLAMFERDKEIVRPEASEPWKVIPEPI